MDLNKLIEVTNEAIERTRTHKSAHVFSVNWIRVSCYEVRKWKNQNGVIGYSVHIVNASPENHVFVAAIYDYLEEAGFSDVEIITEW